MVLAIITKEKVARAIKSWSKNKNKVTLDMLSKSEEKYRTIFEESFDGLFITSPGGKILDMNKSGINLFGYDTIDEIHSLDLEKDVYAFPLDRKRIISMVNAQGFAEYEVPVKKRKGEIIDTYCSLTAVKNKIGEITSYRGVIRDITKQKQAEKQILKLNRIYTVLSNINQSIVRIHEIKELLNEACRIAVEYGKFRMTWIGMVNFQTNKVDVVASNGGVSGNYLNKINIDLNDELRSNGPTGIAVKSGKHKISNNILYDECMIPWRNDAVEYDYKSAAAFPLIVSDKIVGALNIYSNETDFFEEEDIKVLDEMAKDISFALEFIEREAEIKRTNEAITQSLHEKETLIRELYHRTKNTLQLIRGIIVLQAAGFPENEEFQQLVKNTEDRIQAVSLVHQMLYRSQDLSHISIKNYIYELSDLIMQSFEIYRDRISLNLEIDDQYFLIDTAIPLGLILNELMTNSLKYAFSDNRKCPFPNKLDSLNSLYLVFS